MLNTIKSISFIALTLMVGTAHSSAPTYKEKLEEIRERVNIHVSSFGSALEKADTIKQIHDLIFNSDKGHYFDRENGLVQEITVPNYTFDLDEEDTAAVIKLKGHHLKWPAGLDLRQRIANSLQAEQATLTSLLEIRHQLKNTYNNIKFEKPRYRSGGANSSHLENLENLQTSLNANHELRSRFSAYPQIILKTDGGVSDESGVVFQKGTDWEGNPYEVAFINMGHKGLFKHAPYMDDVSLSMSLRMGFLDGFGTKQGYWMKSPEFRDALMVFDNLLRDPNIVNILRENDVHNLEFDREFKNRMELFRDNTLVLGVTEEDMRLVIHTLFE